MNQAVLQNYVPRISRKEFKAFHESMGDVDGFLRDFEDHRGDYSLLILKEQFYLTCPREITEWVKERKPSTLDDTTALADEALLIKPQWKRLLEQSPRQSAPAMTSQGARHQFTLHTSGVPWQHFFSNSRPNPSPLGMSTGPRIAFAIYADNQVRSGIQSVKPHTVNYIEVDPEWSEEMPTSPEEWSSIPTLSVTPRGVYGICKVPQSYPEQRQCHLQDVLLDGCRITGFRDSGALLTIADPRVVRPEAIHPGPGILIEVAGKELKYIPKLLSIWTMAAGRRSAG
ncbi:hypothetical protein XELAEV_18037235mg [Xenopus laevis]|uniref:Uncharacterized protein n=1 Tax=Xenopus laevis TaxID=8355 RepID=A0A974CBZ3_XENLA|nr:hypothetical protein XELAEV_18037235mg [Xenopus laevis]